MTKWKLNTPVALIIFNRPDTTARVFEAIRQAEPPKLFVIADGPRANKPDDADKCAATRAVVERVDWDCEVSENFSEENLGCGLRPASGISWVFEQVEQAIILEDDCLPHPTFFRFCEELLADYRDDERVMHISGTNFLFGRRRADYSYLFSRYPFCWGWATWRRAWRHFDYDLKSWPLLRDGDWLRDVLGEAGAVQHWTAGFEDAYVAGKSHIWDFQWIFALWSQHGLSVVPQVNLVSNIGFGQDATHTLSLADLLAKSGERKASGHSPPPVIPNHSTGVKKLNELYNQLAVSRYSNLPSEAIEFPLRHPPFVIRDARADRYFQKHNYQGGALGYLKRKIKRVLFD